MPGVEARGFDSPDETRTPDKTKVEVVRMDGATAARLTFEPGASPWGGTQAAWVCTRRPAI